MFMILLMVNMLGWGELGVRSQGTTETQQGQKPNPVYLRLLWLACRNLIPLSLGRLWKHINSGCNGSSASC